MTLFSRTGRPLLLCLLLFGATYTGFAQTGKTSTASPSTKGGQPARADSTPAWLGPSEQQRASISEMKLDIERINSELAEAKAEDDRLAGGLIKVQIQMRIEIMKNTVALLEHRIKALETGAKFIPVQVVSAPPDATLVESLEREIASTKDKIAESKVKSDRYSGGLIKAQIDSTMATQSETLAMLEQRHMIAKYGLTRSTVPGSQASALEKGDTSALVGAGQKKSVAVTPSVAETILVIDLISKRRIKQKYDEMIILDMDVSAKGLDRTARAIKGVLKVTDLFGEPRMSINWDFDAPVEPGGVIRERDKGVKYNQFNDAGRWLDSTEQQNMKVIFTVKSILYEDGTRRDF